MPLPTALAQGLDELARQVGTRLHRHLPAGQLEGLDPDCGRAFAPIRNVPSSDAPLLLKRVGYRLQAAMFNVPRETAVRVDEAEVRRGLRTRTYTPFVESGGGLVYFHGGGMVVGDLETVDRWCRTIAVRSGLVVTSVDYRRAPEHGFPAGILDAIMAFNHVAAGWQAQGRPLASLGVGGDSAGGYLSALVAQQAVAPTLGAPVAAVPGFQWLIYPGLDYTWTPEGEFPDGLALDDDVVRWFNRVWSEGHDASAPGMSPALAPDETLRALPPTVVVTCEFDPLTPVVLRYVARLEQAGVEVEHLHLDGLPHDFFQLSGVSPAAEAAGERIIDALRVLSEGALRQESTT